MATNLIGFDSAWSDNPKMPGAICALRLDAEGTAFDPPERVGFEAARRYIQTRHRDGDMTLVAIDQPTIVENESGMRPAERVVASLISWSGGGIQPAYRGKVSMFGDGAPIWRLLAGLGFADHPEAAAVATRGGFVMEVYPALALLGLHADFTAAARNGPRYNPARPTFRQDDWATVLAVASREARRLRLAAVADWCDGLDRVTRPRKAVQDRLDAVLCLLIAVLWRTERQRCAMIGDRASGYIVAPVSDRVRERLAPAAERLGVALR